MLSLALRRLRFTKVEYTNGRPYTVRWQRMMPYAQKGQNKHTDHTKINKNIDSNPQQGPFTNIIRHYSIKYLPSFRTILSRIHRCKDPFQMVVLPSVLSFCLFFFNYSFGFKLLFVYFVSLSYNRVFVKTNDPTVSQYEIYRLLYENAQLAALFNPNSVYALDYECDYLKQIPPQEKFPQLHRKLFRFFNSQCNLTQGHFIFADLNSEATVVMKFKTLPCAGKYFGTLGDPFYIYSLRAELKHKGTFKEIVLRDQKKQLQRVSIYHDYI